MNLHPIDEISIRAGAGASTLKYKQLEAAQIAAQTAEWLAAGGQVETVQSHHQRPFSNGQILTQADKTQLYKFEITPEGKPRPKRKSSCAAQRLAIEAVRDKSEKTKAEILQAMRVHDRPILLSVLAGKVGLSRSSTLRQINQLIESGRVELVGRLVLSNLYEVVK